MVSWSTEHPKVVSGSVAALRVGGEDTASDSTATRTTAGLTQHGAGAMEQNNYARPLGEVSAVSSRNSRKPINRGEFEDNWERREAASKGDGLPLGAQKTASAGPAEYLDLFSDDGRPAGGERPASSRSVPTFQFSTCLGDQVLEVLRMLDVPAVGGSVLTGEEPPLHSGELKHVLSPKQAAQPNPSYLALCRQDTTSPWSTDYGGNS